MGTNLLFRIIGLVSAIVMLCLAKVISPLWLVITFLAALTVHVIPGDAFGDKFFTDEPLGVAITRWAGFGAAWLIGLLHIFTHFGLKGLVWGFAGSLATHLVGDTLSVKDNLPKMDFLSGFVLYNFLGWFGLAGAELTLVLSDAGKVAKGIGTTLFLVAATGLYVSYRIYRDGNDPAAHEPDPAPKS